MFVLSKLTHMLFFFFLKRSSVSSSLGGKTFDRGFVNSFEIISDSD